MKNIANLLVEANVLKHIPRSGYHFLCCGRESVAEHTFSATLIAFVMHHGKPSRRMVVEQLY
jgi:putative hydrolase of HD superfamily